MSCRVVSVVAYETHFTAVLRCSKGHRTTKSWQGDRSDQPYASCLLCAPVMQYSEHTVAALAAACGLTYKMDAGDERTKYGTNRQKKWKCKRGHVWKMTARTLWARKERYDSLPVCVCCFVEEIIGAFNVRVHIKSASSYKESVLWACLNCRAEAECKMSLLYQNVNSHVCDDNFTSED